MIILLCIVGIFAIYIYENDPQKKQEFKEIAIETIEDVKVELLFSAELKEGYYYFTSEISTKGYTKSPLGGNIAYAPTSDVCKDGTRISNKICRVKEGVTPDCSSSDLSFVWIQESDVTSDSRICLTAGEGHKYIDNATSFNLLDNVNFTMIR